MPERMQDQYIRLYSKRREAQVVEVLRGAFALWCAENSCVAPHYAGEMTPSNTPNKVREQRRVAAAVAAMKTPPRALAVGGGGPWHVHLFPRVYALITFFSSLLCIVQDPTESAQAAKRIKASEDDVA